MLFIIKVCIGVSIWRAAAKVSVGFRVRSCSPLSQEEPVWVIHLRAIHNFINKHVEVTFEMQLINSISVYLFPGPKPDTKMWKIQNDSTCQCFIRYIMLCGQTMFKH